MNGNNRNTVTAGMSRGGAVSTHEIKANVHRRLLEDMDLNAASSLPPEELYKECSRRVDALLNEQKCPLSGPEREQLLREVMDETFGLGPLEELLRDPHISDILVNGSGQVYIERFGVLEKTDFRFRSDEQLMQTIQRIGTQVGRRIDESTPMLDARLADGSRVNAIIPPLALDGPSLSIRRFGTIPINVEKLIELGTMTVEMAQFLQACVHCKMNMLISGGTGSGKTTFLNVLSKWVPDDERLITIEDAAELQLQREHVVRLETRPPNIEGRGEYTQRDLLRNSLRMRPDRIIIGEVRGAEALDMLQAMNTGHEGSMTTVHANNPRDAFRRVENMVSIAGINYPIHAIRQQISSALDISIHVDRLTGGRRKVVSIAEVTGMEGDMILLQDIFRFRQTGVGDDGHAEGQVEVCGVRPQLADRLESEGIRLPEDFFGARVLAVQKSDSEGSHRAN
jgi:pilus assembly protein CpaF